MSPCILLLKLKKKHVLMCWCLGGYWSKLHVAQHTERITMHVSKYTIGRVTVTAKLQLLCTQAELAPSPRPAGLIFRIRNEMDGRTCMQKIKAWYLCRGSSAHAPKYFTAVKLHNYVTWKILTTRLLAWYTLFVHARDFNYNDVTFFYHLATVLTSALAGCSTDGLNCTHCCIATYKDSAA